MNQFNAASPSSSKPLIVCSLQYNSNVPDKKLCDYFTFHFSKNLSSFLVTSKQENVVCGLVYSVERVILPIFHQVIFSRANRDWPLDGRRNLGVFNTLTFVLSYGTTNKKTYLLSLSLSLCIAMQSTVTYYSLAKNVSTQMAITLLVLIQ